MNSRADTLFLRALELPSGAERDAFLDEACKDEPELRQQLDAMLADDSAADAFFDGPDTVATPSPRSSLPAEKPGDMIGRFKHLQIIGEGGFGGPRAARFGDYELLRQIGRGGMGVVYEARQTRLNRIVALKMILGGDMASLSSSAVRRFQVEAEAAAKLAHPNIVAIHEFGEREGLPFFSMQRIEGTGLDREMAALALPSIDPTTGKKSIDKTAAGQAQVRIARLVATLARALHYAHEQGVIHCDVKPGNILIDSHGEPHLTDFGIARLLDQEGQLTKSGVIGSPRYMAPEQASGRRGEVTAATDIYGLGVVLYELLTGQPPFRAVTPTETLRQVMEQEPAVPHDSHPLVNRDLSIICLKCLEKNARHRYASAAELADDLERWIRHEPILARRASLPERLVRWCQRKPAIATLAASVALLLITVAIGSVLFAWKRGALLEEREAAMEETEAFRATWQASLITKLNAEASVTITSEERPVLMGDKPGGPAAYHGEELRLKFGLYTHQKPFTMAKRFAPLLSAMEESMAGLLRRPVPIDCIIYPSYDKGHDGFLLGKVDFMRVGSASYVLMKGTQPGISLLVAQEEPSECVIFTRADSGINLSQLRGKSFAFGDAKSTSGSYLPKAYFLGLADPIRASDLSPKSREFPSLDLVVEAVRKGECDAGSANTVAIDTSFKVLYTFTTVLRTPFVARDGIDADVEKALKDALLKVDDLSVLAKIEAKLTGFRVVSDQDYDQLRKEMELAEKFGEVKKQVDEPEK